MKFFCDTSVLIAAVLVQHVHHQRSSAVYLKAEKKTAFCAAHTLAEVYAALTRMPGPQRMEGDQALLVLEDIRRRFRILTLDDEDYFSVIAAAVIERREWWAGRFTMRCWHAVRSKPRRPLTPGI